MSSLTKIEANRQNAQHSSGPKTDQGKAKSCLNNLKHGLRARTVVLPEENREDFDAEYQDLLDHCQPDGPIEHHLVEQMVVYRWKAARTGAFIQHLADHVRHNIENRSAKAADPMDGVMHNLNWYDGLRTNLDHLDVMEQRYDRAYLRAERRLSQLQKERRQQQQPQPEPLPTPEPKPEQESNSAPEPKSEPKPNPQPQPQPNSEPEPQPEAVQVGQAVPPASPQLPEPQPAEPNRKPPAIASAPLRAANKQPEDILKQ